MRKYDDNIKSQKQVYIRFKQNFETREKNEKCNPIHLPTSLSFLLSENSKIEFASISTFTKLKTCLETAFSQETRDETATLKTSKNSHCIRKLYSVHNKDLQKLDNIIIWFSPLILDFLV